MDQLPGADQFSLVTKVSGVDIVNDDVTELLRIIKRCKSLTSIDIENHTINDIGARALVEVIEKSYITKLKLPQGGISEGVLKHLEIALETNEDTISVALDPPGDMMSEEYRAQIFLVGPMLLYAREQLGITDEEVQNIYSATSGKCFESPIDLFTFFTLISHTIKGDLDIEGDGWSDLISFAIEKEIYTEYIVAYLGEMGYLEEAIRVVTSLGAQDWSRIVEHMMQVEYEDPKDNHTLSKLFSALLTPMLDVEGFSEWFLSIAGDNAENITEPFAMGLGMCGINLSGMADDVQNAYYLGMHHHCDQLDLLGAFGACYIVDE